MKSVYFCRTAAAVVSVVAVTAGAPAALAGDWTQVYIGAGTGADAIAGKAGVIEGGTQSSVAEGIGGGDLGISIRAGADYQLSSMFVVGLVGIYDWSNIQTSASVSEDGNSASARLIKLDQSFTIAARAGVLLSADVLAYALAGYSRVKFDDIELSGPFTIALQPASAYDSFVYGAGLEYRITNSLSLFAEYRRADLDRRDLARIGEGEDQVRIWTDPVMHWARIGAAYRFGGSNAAGEQPAESVPAANWTGAYVGAGIGLDAATRDIALKERVETTGCGPIGDCLNAELKGLGGGGLGMTITAGYDMRMGGIVAGAFVDYDWSKHDITARGRFDGRDASVDLLGLDSSWTFGVRVGLLAAEDTLIYGLLGYSRVEFKDAHASAGDDSGTLVMPSFSGVSIGGGFEKLVAANTSLRLEYRYVNLGDEALYNDVDGNFRVTMDPSMHMARAMLAYRF